MVGDRIGSQAWQEFFCVWLELVCNECLGKSGIWSSFDGELWSGATHVSFYIIIMIIMIIHCPYYDTTSDLWSNKSLCPWELPEAKGYIQQYIPPNMGTV